MRHLLSSTRWLPAALAGALAFAVFIGCCNKSSFAGVNSDGAIYLLMADMLSPYRSHHFGFGEFLFAHYPFPPLYPLSLALVGGGSATPHLDYLFDALCLAIAVTATWAWVRRAGGGPPAAAAAAVTLSLTPIALFTVMGLFSEPLYLALSMSALALIAPTKIERRHWYIAAGLLGLAAVTRTVGLFAVAAFLGNWWWQTGARKAYPVVLLATLPPLIWAACKWRFGWSGGYVGSLLDDGFVSAVHGIIEQLPINVRALAYHGVRCFDLLGSVYSAAVVSALTALALITWVARLRTGAVDALYLALYLLVMLLWPYPNDFARFLLIVLPFFAAYACWGAALLLEHCGQRRVAPLAAAATAAVLICIVLPSTLLIVLQIAHADTAQEREFTRISQWYRYDSQSEARRMTEVAVRVLDAMAKLDEYVPPQACVTSIMPEVVMLQARRKSRRPPGIRATLPTLRAVLAECPYVLMLRGTAFPAIDYPLFYPHDRVTSDLEILHAERLDPTQPQGPPMMILARYRGPENRLNGATQIAH